MNYVSGRPPIPRTRRRPPVPTTVQGLPLIKPPYGRITAIDLQKGELVWQVAHGETPDNIRNHPALKGVNIPRTGRQGRIGTLVTKSLVIAGEGGFFTLPDGRRGAMLRAYDKRDRSGCRRRLHAGAADGLADDLHAQRPPVHRRRDQRPEFSGRTDGVPAPAIVRAAVIQNAGFRSQTEPIAPAGLHSEFCILNYSDHMKRVFLALACAAAPASSPRRVLNVSRVRHRRHSRS